MIEREYVSETHTHTHTTTIPFFLDAFLQNSITLNLRVSTSGDYALVLRYFTPRADAAKSQEIDVLVNDAAAAGGNDVDDGHHPLGSGHVVLYGCDYASLCNEVVTDDRGRVLFVKLDPKGDNKVTLVARPGTKVNGCTKGIYI